MAINLLREPDSKVGTVAHEVGYRSVKNFYRILWNLTGMTPSRVRGMNKIDARELLDSRLSLPSRSNASLNASCGSRGPGVARPVHRARRQPLSRCTRVKATTGDKEHRRSNLKPKQLLNS